MTASSQPTDGREAQPTSQQDFAMKTHIKLRPSEIQSGSDRVKWAEGLIRQLPENHDGRNSWLLNYAGEKHQQDVTSPPQPTSPSVDAMREALEQIRRCSDENLGPSRSSLLNKIAKLADAVLSAPRVEPVACDSETVQVLLDLLNPLHGELDRQTYDAKVAMDFDMPSDYAHDIMVTAKMERDLTQAVCILENRKRAVEGDPLSAHPAPPDTVREAWIDQFHQIDRYGVALLMIREGCGDPAGLASRVLSEFGVAALPPDAGDRK